MRVKIHLSLHPYLSLSPLSWSFCAIQTHTHASKWGKHIFDGHVHCSRTTVEVHSLLIAKYWTLIEVLFLKTLAPWLLELIVNILAKWWFLILGMYKNRQINTFILHITHLDYRSFIPWKPEMVNIFKLLKFYKLTFCISPKMYWDSLESYTNPVTFRNIH
jgi:hypothetical protein